ncbi:ArnT family glycosyltransferase [Propionivibrio sp.]|uniref:ArnT family glycosyltransferase n=1 Tax=Propionivibrio sp. TaxID=2212460 RepID=UPI003BF0DDAE
MTTATMATGNPRVHWLLYGLAVLLAVGVYFFDLDGQHIPKNGDENPYAHITRLTAASGHFLPLQSELLEMRNTKPPLLFWQGIVTTHWGAEWTLWHLRYPGVIYTLLTALLVFLLGWRLSREPGKGFVGALAFLAFFSTYRYGRPFLTNPPEVFWLFVPFFVLLYWRSTAFLSRWVPLLLGVAVGIGLLYKSFALLLPVGLGLAFWYLRQRNYRLAPFIREDVWKLALVALISLGIFSLWFVLDPQPQAIWQEFVVKENAGKFDPQSSGYLGKFLWGSSSVWVLALGYPLNAGLLAFPVFGLMIDAVRRRAQLSDAERMLWIWLLVMLVVFSLPSQRSSRYLLAAMPALAVLCALGWERIARLWFILTLVTGAVVVTGLAYLSFRLQDTMPGADLYPLAYWVLLAVTLVFSLAAMRLPALTRAGTSVAVLLVFLSLAAFLHPFNGTLGNYSAETQRRMVGAEVWVPYDFNAKFEAYRFLLPGARIQGYREQREQDVAELAQRYPLFAVRVPLGSAACAGCRVLGERLDLRGRHTPAELNAILHGKVFENLFLKELLIESPGKAPLAGEGGKP